MTGPDPRGTRKAHIRVPSVEGQLGYPPDLVEKYKVTGPDPQALDAVAEAIRNEMRGCGPHWCNDWPLPDGGCARCREVARAVIAALPAGQRPAPGLVEAAREALGRGRGLLAVFHGEFCETADVGRCEDCAADARTFDRLDAALPPKERR